MLFTEEKTISDIAKLIRTNNGQYKQYTEKVTEQNEPNSKSENNSDAPEG